MRTLVKTLAAVIIPALLMSCKNESLESIYSSQENQIGSFIDNLSKGEDPCRVVRNGGSNRIVLTEGEGEELAGTGTVTFYYAGYIFTGGSVNKSNLFATNNETAAAESGWSVTDPDYSVMTVTLGKNDRLVNGLKNGLVGVKGGEICYIVFSGKYGFGKKSVGSVPGNSAIIYQIWVESITNE